MHAVHTFGAVSVSAAAADADAGAGAGAGAGAPALDPDIDATEERVVDVPPALRRVTPGDLVDIVSDPCLDSISLVGTQGEKVTEISGLEGLTALEVL
jgi:hypothetical protein